MKSTGSTTEVSASFSDWFIKVWATVPKVARTNIRASCSQVGQSQNGSAAERTIGDKKIEA